MPHRKSNSHPRRVTNNRIPHFTDLSQTLSILDAKRPNLMNWKDKLNYISLKMGAFGRTQAAVYAINIAYYALIKQEKEENKMFSNGEDDARG